MAEFRIENGILYKYEGYANKINIPEGVTKIATSAFFDCKAFGITIPSSVTEIEEHAFPNLSHLISIQVAEDNPSYTSVNNILIDKRCNKVVLVPVEKTGSITIPDYIEEIGNEAFAKCGNLASITLPPTVKKIGEASFYGCTSLSSITIPEGVEKISDLAFYNCKALSSITLPSSLKEIGFEAFTKCISLTDISIPDSVTRIGVKAFSKCRELKSVKLPKEIKHLDHYAFYSCNSLINISLDKENPRFKYDDGLLIDGKHNNIIFVAMNKKGKVVVPDGSTEIYKSLFKDHKNITSITLPDSVTVVGKRAFWNCENLKHLYLSKNLKTITGTKAKDYNSNSKGFIYGCNSLTSLTLPEGMEEIGEYAFINCYCLYNIKVSNTIKKIANSAFEGCRNLSSIELPDSVIEIGESAFYDCRSLTRVVIPSTIEKIHKWSFSGCTDLVDFNLNNKEMEVDGQWFGAKMSAYSNFYRPVVYERIKAGLKSFYPDQLSYDFIDNIVTKVISLLASKDETLDEQWREAWLKYLRLSRNHYYLEFANNTAFIELILKMDFLKLEDLKDLLAISTEYSLVEVSALLLNYQNEKFDFNELMNYQMEEFDPSFIPSSVTRENWNYLELDDGSLMITNYLGSDLDVVVPYKIGHSYVSAIGKQAINPLNKNISEEQKFTREKIKSITIPQGIKNIESDAFTFCNNLTCITIPESVTNIEPSNCMGYNQNLVIKGKKGSFAEDYTSYINSNIDGEIKFEEI